MLASIFISGAVGKNSKSLIFEFLESISDDCNSFLDNRTKVKKSDMIAKNAFASKFYHLGRNGKEILSFSPYANIGVIEE